MKVAWKAGAPELRAPLEAWLRGEGAPGTLVAASDRRRITRLAAPDSAPAMPTSSPALPTSWLVKRFLPARSYAGWGQRVKEWIGHSPAEREWRALAALHGAGVRVPRPLAWGHLEDGGDLVAMEFIEGELLEECLGWPAERRRRVLVAAGRELTALHRAGWAHRDLHVGNAIAPSGDGDAVAWIDLQRATRSRSSHERLRDWGELDFSLRHLGCGICDRIRTRRVAAEGAPDDDARRRKIREIARASQVQAARYRRSRTRRLLRPGRRFARLRITGRSGLRTHAISDAEVTAALAQHSNAGTRESLKDDHRSLITRAWLGERPVIVKEVRKRGVHRWVADLLRGSPARRAWKAGYGLELRGVRTATPLAYLERRRCGFPVESALLMEDLGARSLDIDRRWSPLQLQETLLRLLIRLHRQNVAHGDLQALHVYLEEEGGQIVPRLIDLEAVRFLRQPSDDQRIQDLAELNSSLADERWGAEDRRECFLRYCQLLPFERGDAAALRAIVDRSLARGHHWLGEGCSRAEALRAREAPVRPSITRE